MSPFKPRVPLPTGGITTPHVQSFHGARYFLELLEYETAAVFDRARELGNGDEALANAAAQDALTRQALSEAVQVFCAMTVEGVVNVLGVMILGEHVFQEKLERKPLLEKLASLLPLMDDKPLSENVELLETAGRLAGARNQFVHPKPREGWPVFDNAQRQADLQGARAAIADIDQFFLLLRNYNPNYAAFFILF